MFSISRGKEKQQQEEAFFFDDASTGCVADESRPERDTQNKLPLCLQECA